MRTSIPIDDRAYEILQATIPYFSAIRWRDKTEKTIAYGPIDPPDDPKQKFFLTLDLDTKFFERYAKFEFAAFKDSDTHPKTWWEGGMQRYVVGTVHAVADDLDEGIFLLYAAMNDPDYPMFLGRLKPDDAFTVAVADRLRTLVAL